LPAKITAAFAFGLGAVRLSPRPACVTGLRFTRATLEMPLIGEAQGLMAALV
jgi:hypothetical protein